MNPALKRKNFVKKLAALYERRVVLDSGEQKEVYELKFNESDPSNLKAFLEIMRPIIKTILPT